jgi:hypothetical protein
MATPEKTAQLLLSTVFLLLGAWLLLFPAPYMEPPPASAILLQAVVSITLIAIGLSVLFFGRIRRFVNRNKET